MPMCLLPQQMTEECCLEFYPLQRTHTDIPGQHVHSLPLRGALFCAIYYTG